MDTNDEWISSRTGIRSRHISIEDTTSTMAVKAAEKALEDAGISAEELDHIFVATLSGDYATPSTACQVQKGIEMCLLRIPVLDEIHSSFVSITMERSSLLTDFSGRKLPVPNIFTDITTPLILIASFFSS